MILKSTKRGQISTFNKIKIGFAEPMLPQRRQKAAAREATVSSIMLGTNMEVKNIYDHIKEISIKPTMYLGDNSIEKLEAYLWGYSSALNIHGIYEKEVPYYRHFYDWLRFTYKINTIKGFKGILETCENDEEAMQKFFSYIDEFSQLKLECGKMIYLSENQKFSDEYYEANAWAKNEKTPKRLQIISLKPGDSCFVRNWYTNKKYENDLSLSPNIDSLYFSINWKFGLNFKNKS